MTSTAIAVTEQRDVTTFSRDQVELLKRTVASGTSDDEFALFGEVVKRTGLDPFTNQIYCIVRGQGQYRKVTFQTGIDGYRLIAERTGEMDGLDGPFWCGADGEWRDVWVSDDPPVAAKVAVYRRGQARPYVGIAKFSEYKQTTRDKNGQPILTEMWRKMSSNQLAKCAEALALRRAFPREMSGVYTHEEMQQADNNGPEVWKAENVTPKAVAAPASAPRPQTPRQEGIERGRAEMARQEEAKQERKAAAGGEPAWLVELKSVVEARGMKMSDFAPIVGAPVTVRILNQWIAKNVPNGNDPVRELMSVYDAENAAEEAVDKETGEIIEGSATPLPFDDDAPPAPEYEEYDIEF